MSTVNEIQIISHKIHQLKTPLTATQYLELIKTSVSEKTINTLTIILNIEASTHQPDSANPLIHPSGVLARLHMESIKLAEQT